ncbi:MAG: DUF2384 domain-containing protein [Proteobacteria bacterium]|nr:MAG: DUF2384 domain-containing protein [Pseudomonadota bacterium]
MNDEQLARLTRECLGLMAEWGVELERAASILGFPKNTRIRQIRRYFEGYAFPDDPVVIERARRVIHLGDALRTTYPTNRRMPAYWMRQPNKRFSGRTPLERLGDGDDNALVAVISVLDCAYAWDLNR